jgi:hypothetical protein
MCYCAQNLSIAQMKLVVRRTAHALRGMPASTLFLLLLLQLFRTLCTPDCG